MGVNAYVLFGWKSTFYQHRMVAKLKEDEIVDDVGGYVAHEKFYNYLKEQNDFEYDVLHHEAELHSHLEEYPRDPDHLEDLEERYGTPTLQPFAFRLEGNDRYVDKSLNLYRDVKDKQHRVQQCFDFFLDVFENLEPDMLLTYTVASGINLTAHQLVKEHGGKSILWRETNVSDKYDLIVNNVEWEFDRINKRFRELQHGDARVEMFPDALEQARVYLEDFRSSTDQIGSVPDALKPSLDSVGSTAAAPYRALRYFVYYHFDIGEDIYLHDDWRRDPLHRRVLSELKHSYRLQRIRRTNFFDEPRLESDRFIYFPLHLQPEASTLLYGRPFLDQIALVQQIGQSLPLNHRLYVKEHPHMNGFRDIDYLKRLKKIDAVKLIHPDVSSRELIDHSDMVATITGTTGLEALLLEKPVITFGHASYNIVPLVYRGSNLCELDEKLYDGVSNYEHDERVLIRYLTAIFEEGFSLPGGPGSTFTGSKDTADDVAEAILGHVRPHLEDGPSAEW
jgi:hypothetical protein